MNKKKAKKQRVVWGKVPIKDCPLCGGAFSQSGESRYSCAGCPLQFDCSTVGVFILEERRFGITQFFSLLGNLRAESKDDYIRWNMGEPKR